MFILTEGTSDISPKNMKSSIFSFSLRNFSICYKPCLFIVKICFFIIFHDRSVLQSTIRRTYTCTTNCICLGELGFSRHWTFHWVFAQYFFQWKKNCIQVNKKKRMIKIIFFGFFVCLCIDTRAIFQLSGGCWLGCKFKPMLGAQNKKKYELKPKRKFSLSGNRSKLSGLVDRNIGMACTIISQKFRALAGNSSFLWFDSIHSFGQQNFKFGQVKVLSYLPKGQVIQKVNVYPCSTSCIGDTHCSWSASAMTRLTFLSI
jgi:hypothetical protein